MLIFTCGFKQYGIYLMDPYLRKLLCANPYLWIQTIWAAFKQKRVHSLVFSLVRKKI